MCGRFAVIQSQDDLADLFEIERVAEDVPPPSYNIAPTERVPVVLESAKEGSEGRRLEGARWGLVPSFAKDISVGVRAFNARVETIATNGMFKTAYVKRRAIVPAAGYYEWQKLADGKQPYFLHPADGSPLAFAGLYEWWKNPADGQWLLSTTIITRPATGELEEIHDRMPLFLAPELWGDWLDPRSKPSEELVQHALDAGSRIGDGFELRPVGSAVGPTRNKIDDPSLLEPV
ncbi:putative SOS response-associated peptidase YedK [Diaminobutyricimonas aerilata]|uniref:Abasic site processing protein n=1 Tax=Diaminobutyricimonas aerilata TaxID=1162967 RepID=A0A2M9CJV2_9MICO|nr:SOS response-associated peptidase [Diaminobutyricimonas aerilata]PJJ72174.1 putative SOS response-associated peptidase YedK [Diaminobutyricimonas aerilata]